MNKIIDLINTNKMSLFVSLPSNNYDLAKAAWEHGADAIKVHIDVDHNASKSTFGTLESEKTVLKKIIKDSPVPVGIVIGGSVELAEKNIQEVIDMGFDFISLYGHDTPLVQGLNHQIPHMFAINYSYSNDEIKDIASSGIVDMIEMSILPPEKYGTRINLRNLLKYKKIKEITNLPTILPSQHLILPEDIKHLFWANINVLMIGAIVTGKTVTTLTDAVVNIRKAIDELKDL